MTLARTANDATEHTTGKTSLKAADSYTFANYSDWRLPNIKELSSLAARDRYNPTINSTVFPNTPSSYYWSASPYASYRGFAWQLNFKDGNDYLYFRDSNYVVRLVRVGQ